MIGSVILYALNILGAVWLESKMSTHYVLELALIVCMLFAAMVLSVAELRKLRWAHAGQVLFFAALALNDAFIFLGTGSFLAFSLTTVLALAGLLRAVSRLDDPREEPVPVKLETYGAEKRGRLDDPLYVEPVMWVHPDELVPEVSSQVDAVKVKKTTRSAKKSTRKSANKKTTRRKTKKSARRATSQQKLRRAQARKKARKTSKKSTKRKATKRRKSTKRKTRRSRR